MLNRNGIQASFGSNLIAPPSTVFSLTTWKNDQWFRAKWFGVFLVTWFAIGALVNPNHLSLQEFYRDRLRDMWLNTLPESGDNAQPMRLSELGSKRVAKTAFPYTIINATAHVLSDGAAVAFGDAVDTLPRQLRFEFTPSYSGYARPTVRGDKLERLYIPTKEYEQQPHLDLPGVMAISGSAVSPAMTQTFVLKTLLFISNLRLGQWVIQPDRRVFHMPLRPVRLLGSLWGAVRKGSVNSPFLFLSDGGHYDNLGIEALLDRRVETIVCVDASHDPEGRFVDFLKVVRRSRFIDGVQIVSPGSESLRFDDCEQLRGAIASSHFVVADIRYPDCSSPGRLYYVKPNFDMDEPAEVISYRDENPEFPHDPTLDQFYDERRFECYRSLGWHICGKFLWNWFPESKKSVPASPDDNLDDSASTPPAQKTRLLQIARALSGSIGSQVDDAVMELKVELLDRQTYNVPLEANELSALRRALLNVLKRRPEGMWAKPILFDCITDLISFDGEEAEKLLELAKQDGDLVRCASSLRDALHKHRCK